MSCYDCVHFRYDRDQCKLWPREGEAFARQVGECHLHPAPVDKRFGDICGGFTVKADSYGGEFSPMMERLIIMNEAFQERKEEQERRKAAEKKLKDVRRQLTLAKRNAPH